jgi:sulfur carrier protein
MTQEAVKSTVTINGEAVVLTAASVAELVESRIGEAKRGIAVALNGAVVPRADWAGTPLQAGDKVEIVRVLQGG